MFSRAQVSIVERAVFVPERWPAARGRCRCCAQRPLPSMITATCRGRRARASFSKRSASSGVNGPSAPEAETCSVVCDLMGGTGFLRFLLYAAKLTYDLAAAQCQVAVSSITGSNTFSPGSARRRRTRLEERGVDQYERQDNHGNRRDPSNDVKGERIDMFAHQIAPVDEQQNEDDHHGQP